MIYFLLFLLATLACAHAAMNHTANQDECTITPDNPCDFKDMTRLTLVSPGGKTHCADGSEYSFRVLPGSGVGKDNVLLFFQGGGGCFGMETCEPALNKVAQSQMGEKIYKDRIDQNGLEGMLNQTDARNYFRKWTIVQVLYCTGDTHLGDSKTPVLTGKTVLHNGAFNVESVLKWYYKNLPEPKQLVISGCSAGSIGAQVWSGNIIAHYKQNKLQTKITFVGDSFVGLLPRDKSGLVAYRWGSCKYDFNWSSQLKLQCDQKRLYFPNFIANVIRENPDVQFAFVQSRKDKIQKLFYCLVAEGIDFTNFNKDKFFNCIPQQQFDEGVESVFNLYRAMGHNNVRTYLVDGEQHCYFPDQLYHTAIAQHNTCIQPAMNKWVQDIVEGKSVHDVPLCGHSNKDTSASTSLPESGAIRSSISSVLAFGLVWLYRLYY